MRGDRSPAPRCECRGRHRDLEQKGNRDRPAALPPTHGQPPPPHSSEGIRSLGYAVRSSARQPARGAGGRGWGHSGATESDSGGDSGFVPDRWPLRSRATPTAGVSSLPTRTGAHGRPSVCERLAIRQSRKAIANITAPHMRSDTSTPMAIARRLWSLLGGKWCEGILTGRGWRDGAPNATQMDATVAGGGGGEKRT